MFSQFKEILENRHDHARRDPGRRLGRTPHGVVREDQVEVVSSRQYTILCPYPPGQNVGQRLFILVYT